MGPRLPFLKNLAAQLGIRERAVFPGEVDGEEIVSLYHDVLIYEHG
jgi:glycosyltransferase involved in cell wall biosynthesis